MRSAIARARRPVAPAPLSAVRLRCGDAGSILSRRMEPSSHELAAPIERMTLRQKLGIYAHTITTHPARLPLEQLVFLLASWVPTALGVGLRSLLYPLVVRSQWPLIVEK